MERMAVPADIANSCLFLASPLSSYVNGGRHRRPRRRRIPGSLHGDPSGLNHSQSSP